MSIQLRTEPILFCFAGPTASGKSTICRELKKADKTLRLSVSTTTRKPRAGERDSVDYYFVSEEEFQARVAACRFLEHAEFSGHHYGTEVTNIESARAEGQDLLLDIEVQGVEQLKSLSLGNVVTVFVFPKSFDTLKKRLKKRRSENAEQVQLRLETAENEIRILANPDFSDFFLINDCLETAVLEAKSVVSAERMRLGRMDPESLDNVLK